MDNPTRSESDFAQAKKYGEDLVKLFAIEKAKRIKLEISNQKMEAIFSTTPDGLVVLDEALNITEANPAFWSVVEQQEPEYPVPLASVIPYTDLTSLIKGTLPDEQAMRKLELDIQITDKVQRTLLINAVPLSASGQHGWVLSIHDLTERKRLESLKSEFINIAAHELRTPLAAILGFSQVLKENLEESDDDLSIHLANTILSSSNRLKDIIDELIEFADIRYQHEGSSGSTNFNLNDIIRHTADLMSHLAREKKITLQATSEQAAINITGNDNILKEILKHLTENAIIFNQPGGKVIIRAKEQDGLAIVDVEDTGIGIPQTEIDKIFDKFYQVEEHLTRSIGGLGLGLAIAQRGIQLYGGTISVTSKLGEGSCFTITLPQTSDANIGESEDGLKDAYHQTIAYGKDLARAVKAERVLAKKVESFRTMGRELQEALNRDQPKEALQAIIDSLNNE